MFGGGGGNQGAFATGNSIGFPSYRDGFNLTGNFDMYGNPLSAGGNSSMTHPQLGINPRSDMYNTNTGLNFSEQGQMVKNLLQSLIPGFTFDPSGLPSHYAGGAGNGPMFQNSASQINNNNVMSQWNGGNTFANGSLGRVDQNISQPQVNQNLSQMQDMTQGYNSTQMGALRDQGLQQSNNNYLSGLRSMRSMTNQQGISGSTAQGMQADLVRNQLQSRNDMLQGLVVDNANRQQQALGQYNQALNSNIGNQQNAQKANIGAAQAEQQGQSQNNQFGATLNYNTQLQNAQMMNAYLANQQNAYNQQQQTQGTLTNTLLGSFFK